MNYNQNNDSNHCDNNNNNNNRHRIHKMPNASNHTESETGSAQITSLRKRYQMNDSSAQLYTPSTNDDHQRSSAFFCLRDTHCVSLQHLLTDKQTNFL